MTTPPEPQDRAEMLAHYSAALDEIHRLRGALLYEARVIEGHLLLAGFPKSRRSIAEQQVERMRAAVRGAAWSAYAGVMGGGTVQGLLIAAGASPTLTRTEWEQTHG